MNKFKVSQYDRLAGGYETALKELTVEAHRAKITANGCLAFYNKQSRLIASFAVGQWLQLEQIEEGPEEAEETPTDPPKGLEN